MTLLHEAWREAGHAAQQSKVEVRSLEPADFETARQVIELTWGRQQMPQTNLLQALLHSGNPVVGAFRDGDAVGVCFGFLGWAEGLHLHSHMTAVIPEGRSAGIGYALKMHQRAACLENGVREVRWTYDPLVARNAHFNLARLGAHVRAFFPDFYGEMDDTTNAGDHSDRFEVSWELDAPTTGMSETGTSSRPEHLVAIPQDFEALRRTDPAQARELRLSVREGFERLFSAGLEPRWTPGGYIFVDPNVHD